MQRIGYHSVVSEMFEMPNAPIAPLVDLMKTLAHPMRLRILALLEKDELSVQELQDITRMGQSRISTHLGLLQEAGFLQSRREGKRTFYRVDPAALRRVHAVLRVQAAVDPDDRDLVAVALLESWIAIDIDDIELETILGLQLAQPGNHFVAQMAIAAAVKRQPGRRVSQHPPGTERKASLRRAG